MGMFVYVCSQCSLKFERIRSPKESSLPHDCPRCKTSSPREFVAPIGFSFNTSMPTYQNIDRVIGKSANEKWTDYHEKQSVKDKIRKESGTLALSKTQDGGYAPVKDSKIIAERKAVYDVYKTAVKTGNVQGDSSKYIDSIRKKN